MPELPEVEAIKIQLEKFLKGHVIEDVILNTPSIFGGDVKEIISAKVTGVRRFAKVLSIDLDNGFSLVAHIKLTGQFIYIGKNNPNPKPLSKKVIGSVPGKHTHVVFKLSSDSFLYYNDVRRFGWIRIFKTSDVEKENFISKLGYEPFKDLTLEIFKDILAKTKRSIKMLLMDQSKIGGIGNIYANDALWLAQIHPEKKANLLTDKEAEKLYNAINRVLKKGLEKGGASELAFVKPDGQEGTYQNYTLAYGKDGQECPRCKKAKFEKYFLGGRGTYICKVCQRK